MTTLVLFSADDCLWKIGDFGITTEGTSRRECQTKEARGTAGYRAPELLGEFPTFSNNVDIFALVTDGRNTFKSDWDVHDYKTRNQLDLSFHGIVHRYDV